MSIQRRLAQPPAVFRVGAVSWPLPLRALAATAGGAVPLVLLVTIDLAASEYTIGPGETFRALVIGDNPAHAVLIRQFRLPQTTVAVLVEAALGLSGALTQTIARNPLASPDILGVTRAPPSPPSS